MQSRLRFSRKILLLFGLVNISFLLMGGCINPLVGPSIGEAEIEGRVLFNKPPLDKLTGLPGALISVENSLENTYTGPNGEYKLIIRYRIGNLAKSAQLNVKATHENSTGEQSKQVVIKDGFTSVVEAMTLTITP